MKFHLFLINLLSNSSDEPVDVIILSTPTSDPDLDFLTEIMVISKNGFLKWPACY